VGSPRSPVLPSRVGVGAHLTRCWSEAIQCGLRLRSLCSREKRGSSSCRVLSFLPHLPFRTVQTTERERERGIFFLAEIHPTYVSLTILNSNILSIHNTANFDFYSNSNFVRFACACVFMKRCNIWFDLVRQVWNGLIYPLKINIFFSPYISGFSFNICEVIYVC
jgi:hypothetical protein